MVKDRLRRVSAALNAAEIPFFSNTASGTGRLTEPTLIAGGAGLLGVAALLGAMVFVFQTPHGTLRVEITDPDGRGRPRGRCRSREALADLGRLPSRAG